MPPELETQNAPQTGSQSTGQAAPTAPAQTAGADAEWGKQFKSADDLYKSYKSLEEKLGTQGNELGSIRQLSQQLQQERNQYAQATQAWDQWYRANLAPHWDKVERFIQGQGQAPQAQGQPQQALDAQQQAQWMEGWEYLSPTDQAKRLQQAVSQGVVQTISSGLTPALQNWTKQFYSQYQNDLKQREAYFNNYLNLYRQVMDMRLKDPSLDVDKVLDQALRVLSNQENPIELGRRLATMDIDKETYAKSAIEQARKDWEEAEKNKAMAAVNVQQGQPPAFRPQSAGVKSGLASRREAVAKAILEKHGPTAF